MESQGYRKQQEETEAVAPVEQRLSSPVSSVLVGVAAIAVTAVALFVLFRLMSGGPTVAQSPAGGGPQMPGMAAGGEDLGSKDAPIQVKGFPGHCEDHMKVCAVLRDLAKEHPDAIHVTIGEMQSPEASALGLTCASYVMKFDRFAELDYKPEGQTTGGEYEVLATKSPSGGASWTAADLEALFNKAIGLAEEGAAPADKVAAAGEADPDVSAEGAVKQVSDPKDDEAAAPDEAKPDSSADDADKKDGADKSADAASDCESGADEASEDAMPMKGPGMGRS